MKRCYFLFLLLLFVSLTFFSQTEAEENKAFLSFESEAFQSVVPGERITVSHDIPETLLDKDPMIGIFNMDHDFDSAYALKSSMIFEKIGKTLFYAPRDEGDYYLCLFIQGEKLSDPLSFEVAKRVLNTKILINQYQAETNEIYTVSFEGAPGNEYDWIGLYKIDGDHYNYYSYDYLYGEVDGTIDVFMPDEPGSYHFRLFEDDTYNMIAESEVIEVQDGTGEKPLGSSVYNTFLEIDFEAAFPDEQINVYYYDAPGYETDWIGMYKADDTEGNIIDWMYTDGLENGNVTFYAPYEPGNYVFRFFPNDTFDILAESEQFAVLDVETTNPEDADEKVMVREAVFCETVEDDLPINEKLDFTYTDESVYLWLMLGSFKGAHEGIWEWYYPNGDLYDTVYLDIPSAYERGMEQWDSLSLWSWIPIKDETEKQAGVWKVFFYIDDELVLAKQFTITENQTTKRPVIETTEKTIQIGELSLKVPVNAEWFEDSDYEDLFYINLDPEKDVYPLIGIEFSNEELLYQEGEAFQYQSKDFYFEGWDYISYDEEYDITDRIIDLKITNAYDSYGNEIYLFLVCPEEDYDEWEDKFTEILDSVQINLQ